MGRGWKSFEGHARKSFHCHEPTIKGDSGGSSERKEQSCKETFSLLREYLSNTEHDLRRNMNGKGQSDQISDGNEEHVIGKWKKGQPCYKVQGIWLNCISVLVEFFQEVELASD